MGGGGGGPGGPPGMGGMMANSSSTSGIGTSSSSCATSKSLHSFQVMDVLGLVRWKVKRGRQTSKNFLLQKQLAIADIPERVNEQPRNSPVASI